MMFYDVYPRKSYADFIKPSFETVKRIGYYSKNPESVIVANKAFNGTHGKEFPLGLRRYSDRRYYYEGNGGVITIKYQNTVMGYVHPDDTFEFTNTRNWASYNCKQDILNRLFNAFALNRLSREGGMVLIKRDVQTVRLDRSVQYVVFDGLRVNINTLELHPSSNHHIEVTYLDRKLTKAIRDKHEDEFKAARAFIMAANAETLRQDHHDIRHSHERDLYEQFVSYIWRRLNLHSFRNSSMSYLNKLLEDKKTYWFDKAKKKILEDIYLKEEQPFKTRYLQAGERIPTGNWGFRIVKHTGA